jgi:hypothetical protein
VLVVEAELGWKSLRKHINLRHMPWKIETEEGTREVLRQLPPTRKSCRKGDAALRAYHLHLHEMGNQNHAHE